MGLARDAPEGLRTLYTLYNRAGSGFPGLTAAEDRQYSKRCPGRPRYPGVWSDALPYLIDAVKPFDSV